MAAGEVIYAENLGEEPIVWKWASQKYKLPPHQIAIVPWEAMCLYMGNPELVDVDDRRRYRTDELKRLYFKHGAHDGDPTKWEANKPRVRCTDLDDQVFITVVDDPYGEHLMPDVSTKAQNQMLQERMRRLEAELKSLKRADRASEDAMASESAATQVTEDGGIEAITSSFENAKPDKPNGPSIVAEDIPSNIPSEIGS